jgi:hypothetical protein
MKPAFAVKRHIAPAITAQGCGQQTAIAKDRMGRAVAKPIPVCDLGLCQQLRHGRVAL